MCEKEEKKTEDEYGNEVQWKGMVMLTRAAILHCFAVRRCSERGEAAGFGAQPFPQSNVRWEASC